MKTLLEAIKTSDLTSIEEMISQGVNINQPLSNADGRTPLHLACSYVNLDLMQLLLQANCDANISDDEGLVAIELLQYVQHKNTNFENALIDLLRKTDKSPLSTSAFLWNYSVWSDSTLLAEELLTHEKKLDHYMLNSGLTTAAHMNNLKILNWLVQHHVPLNLQNCSGDTALHLAAVEGNFEAATILLEAGADPSIKNKKNDTPLRTLLEELRESSYSTSDKEKLLGQQRNTLAIIMALLKKHGLEHYQGEQSHFIFHILFSEGTSLYLMLKELIHYLLDIGANLPTKQSDQCRIINSAISHNDIILLEKICVGDTPHAFDSRCYAALLAADNFNKEIMGKLITWGLNVNGTFDLSYKYGNGFGRETLLSYVFIVLINIKDESILPNAATFVEFLIDHGANTHVFNSSNISLLHYACKMGWDNLVLKLLQPEHNYSIDQRATSNNHTPLQEAVISNQIDIAKILIDKGADVTIKISGGKSLVYIATEKRNLEMLLLLLQAGSDVNIGKRTRTLYGERFSHNPLHLALEKDTNNHNLNEIVSLLLDYNAEVDYLAFHIAMQNHNVKLGLIKRIVNKIDRCQLRDSQALHQATICRRIDVLNFLIDEFYELLRNSIDGNGRNALFSAIENDNKDCYELLINAGENLNHIGFDALNLSAYALCFDGLLEFGLPLPQGFSLEAFKIIRTKLLKQAEFKSMSETDRPYQIGTCCYKLIALFGSVDQALQFIGKFKDPKSRQPIHDLCLFNLPETSEKLSPHWSQLALSHGPALTKYLQIAPAIDLLLKEPPKSLIEIKLAAKKVTYNRANENPALAQLFLKHNISEVVFNRILEQHCEKEKDNIPDILIDGKDFKEPRFYMKKLPSNDSAGYILGNMTACCQSVGGAGEVCARYGMRSPNAGFYVVYKRAKEKDITKHKQLLQKANNSKNANEFFNPLTPKSQKDKYRNLSNEIAESLNVDVDDYTVIELLREKISEDLHDTQKGVLIAQSLVWISRNKGFVFDSWERRRVEDNHLCWPFLERAAKILILEHGFKRVVIGASGNTPYNIGAKQVSEIEFPIDYYDYRDSHEQLLIDSVESLQNKTTKKTNDNNVATDLINQSNLFNNPMDCVKDEFEQLRKMYAHNDNVTFLTPLYMQTLNADKLNSKEFEKEHPHTYIQPLLKRNDMCVAIVFRGFVENKEHKDVAPNKNYDIIYIDVEGEPCYHGLIGHYRNLLNIHLNDRDIKRNNLIYNTKDPMHWLHKQIIGIIDAGNLTVTPVGNRSSEPIQIYTRSDSCFTEGSFTLFI